MTFKYYIPVGNHFLFNLTIRRFIQEAIDAGYKIHDMTPDLNEMVTFYDTDYSSVEVK